MTQRIDLHLHSDASDGAVSVEVLIARAALSGLTTLAITEHDNVDSWERGRTAAKQNGIRVMPGIEISTRADNQDIHLLGYDFSPESAVLRDLIDHQRLLRRKRFQAMLNRLKEIGIRLSAANIHTEKTSAPGRVHVAQAMVDAGIVPDVESAFKKYLRYGRPAYVPHETIPPADAIRLVHEAGGFVSLAHPVFSSGGERLCEKLADAGLDAVEVLHPKHTPALQKKLIHFCQRRNLMTTGGSDWHGTLGETYDLGEWFLQGNGASSRASLKQILKNVEPVRPSRRSTFHVQRSTFAIRKK